MNQRPLAVFVIACLYIAVGVVGFAYHWRDLRESLGEAVSIELVRLVAVVSGVFLLRGRNWARWLTVGWMAFHVVIGALHSVGQFAVHLVFCVLIGYFLWRPAVNGYFEGKWARGGS